MQQDEWRGIVTSAKSAILSTRSWGKITEAAWNVMITEVQAVFSLEAQFLFIEAIYLAALSEKKYERPPKGVLLKHLCIFLDSARDRFDSAWITFFSARLTSSRHIFAHGLQTRWKKWRHNITSN